MDEITDEQIAAYSEALCDLIEEGFLNMGDRWLMKAACERAGINWETAEAHFFGTTVRLQ